MIAHDRLENLIAKHDVVLFMKGTRTAPQCGFSQRVVDILDQYLEDYLTVDVLADPSIREGIKSYSNWPSLPQLYVRREFVGGSDIIQDMLRSGELEKLLGHGPITFPTPTVTVTAAARNALRRFWEDEGEPIVRLTVGADFEPLLDMDERRDGDVIIGKPGLTLVMVGSTARRVDGVVIDFVDQSGQMGFKVDNPNRPASVQQLAVKDLKQWIDKGKPHLLIDVRTDHERSVASIPSAVALDERLLGTMEEMDRETVLAFVCHHGGRSQRAAQQAVVRGFRSVYNVRGGIDAWSLEIDTSVPRY